MGLRRLSVGGLGRIPSHPHGHEAMGRWRRGVGAPASAGGGWRWAAMEGRSRSEGVAAGGGADGPGGATAGRTAVDAKAALSL